MLALVFLLPPIPARADDDVENGTKTTGVIARDPDRQIRHLNLAPAPNSDELNNDEKNIRFFLDGELHRSGWQLSIGKKQLPASFQLALPIRKERMSLVFTARGPNGEVEKERVEIRILDWEIVRRKIEAAKEGGGGGDDQALKLTSVRVYSVFATQNLNLSTTAGVNLSAYSYTGGASWTPSLRVVKEFGIMADLGVVPIKKLTGGYYPAMEYAFLLVFPRTYVLHLEGGYGGQTWVNYGGTRGMAVGNLGVRAKTTIISNLKMDEVFFGYSMLLESTHAHQIRMGLQFTF
jgi:hypothetical protein